VCFSYFTLWAEGALTYRQLLTVFDFVSNIAASDFSGLRRHLAWILRGSCCTLYRQQHHNSDRSQPAYFAFSFSGNAHKNGSGNIWLIDLVPDNHNSGFPLTLNGVNTTNSHVAGSLFSATEWNSGFLSAYLSTFNFGHPSYPLNPVPRESIRARMATSFISSTSAHSITRRHPAILLSA